jgi:hypothetical protein
MLTNVNVNVIRQWRPPKIYERLGVSHGASVQNLVTFL